MPVTERATHLPATITAAVVCLMFAGAAWGQTLPRIDRAVGIDEAVELAERHSLRVKAAGADARAMESMRREALAPFWPQVSANGYFADQSMAPNVYTSAGGTMARNYQVFDARQTRDANVTVMYPLFSGGRDYYGYQAASRRAESAREMRRGTEVSVAMRARLDYIAALREAENVGVTGDLIRQLDERLRVTREAFDAGRVPRFYVLRDEAERANAVQMDAMARSRHEQALVALKTTLGLDLDSQLTLSDRLEHAPVLVSLPEAIREASERHPEVRAAVRQREAAEAEVRAAYGNYFPQVSVSYMYDWARTRNGDVAGMGTGTQSADGYSVGVVVTLPIFDGFMRENAVNTAKARLERAVQTEGLARQQVAQDVSQAALMLAAADKSVEAGRVGVARAEEDFRVVQERFEAGRGIQVEMLDAQAALTRARFNLVSALAEHGSALAMWLAGTGRVR